MVIPATNHFRGTFGHAESDEIKQASFSDLFRAAYVTL